MVVNSTVSIEEIPLAAELARGYENIYWTLGRTASNLDLEKVEETIRLARKHRKDIVGLGEVGLDYYWVKN